MTPLNAPHSSNTVFAKFAYRNNTVSKSATPANGALSKHASSACQLALPQNQEAGNTASAAKATSANAPSASNSTSSKCAVSPNAALENPRLVERGLGEERRLGELRALEPRSVRERRLDEDAVSPEARGLKIGVIDGMEPALELGVTERRARLKFITFASTNVPSKRPDAIEPHVEGVLVPIQMESDTPETSKNAGNQEHPRYFLGHRDARVCREQFTDPSRNIPRGRNVRKNVLDEEPTNEHAN